MQQSGGGFVEKLLCVKVNYYHMIILPKKYFYLGARNVRHLIVHIGPKDTVHPVHGILLVPAQLKAGPHHYLSTILESIRDLLHLVHNLSSTLVVESDGAKPKASYFYFSFFGPPFFSFVFLKALSAWIDIMQFYISYIHV